MMTVIVVVVKYLPV